MGKIGQNRHAICKIPIVFETANEIEKNSVGNAYMRSVELRFVVFSRAIDNRPYRGNCGFCGGFVISRRDWGIPPYGVRGVVCRMQESEIRKFMI